MVGVYKTKLAILLGVLASAASMYGELPIVCVTFGNEDLMRGTTDLAKPGAGFFPQSMVMILQ